MENPKKYRPTMIPRRYKDIINALDYYGLGKPTTFIEFCINQNAIASIEEIMGNPQKFEAESDVEFLAVVLKWLRKREQILVQEIYHKKKTNPK